MVIVYVVVESRLVTSLVHVVHVVQIVQLVQVVLLANDLVGVAVDARTLHDGPGGASTQRRSAAMRKLGMGWMRVGMLVMGE